MSNELPAVDETHVNDDASSAASTLPAAADVNQSVEDSQIYGLNFWLAYVANVCLVCANSLTFHFADFVASLGGTEATSGQIVSAGLVAAVGMRFVLGQGLDHFGARRVWLMSSLLYISAGLLFLSLTTLSPVLWLARIGYQVGMAGMFSSSMVHIQNQVPTHRRTEVIGSLGSSGFLGTILGTQLSDWCFVALKPTGWQFTAMFAGAATLGFLHAVVVLGLTRHDAHERPDVTPGGWKLLMRYWPGNVVWVASAMGTSFSVTTVFLTRFATSLGFSGIGTFFLAYSITAFSCRWLLREWSLTGGRHRMILWGLGAQTLGLWSFCGVAREWHFLVPALLCGFGHALLFPAVVSLGAGKFPVQFRGSGTTLVLGFIEMGTIFSAPLLGFTADYTKDRWILPPGTEFAPMFVLSGLVAGAVGLLYAATTARRPDREMREVASRRGRRKR